MDIKNLKISYTDGRGKHECEIRGDGEMAYILYEALYKRGVMNLDVQDIPAEQ